MTKNYSIETIKETISKFNELIFVVVGDVMLDTYIYGSVEKLNPEKPAEPLMLYEYENNMLGGAANTANNLVHLGANVKLCGTIAKDDAGGKIWYLCSESKIKANLLEIKRRTTTHKTRLIGSGSYLARFDNEDITPLNHEETLNFNHILSNHNDNFHVLIFSDYNKGLINEEVVRSSLALAKKNDAYVIAQPKPENIKIYSGIDLIMLNLEEAEKIVSEKIGCLRELKKKDIDSYRTKLGEILIDKFSYSLDIIVTLGKDGSMYYGKNMKRLHVPTKPVLTTDATYQGAGDTALAAFSLGYAATNDIEISMDIANHAAWAAIQQPGTTAVTLEMLLDSYG
ncbi:MAG: PfkB family carbohydrate kinase [Nanoarchaeota archaeon]